MVKNFIVSKPSIFAKKQFQPYGWGCFFCLFRVRDLNETVHLPSVRRRRRRKGHKIRLLAVRAKHGRQVSPFGQESRKAFVRFCFVFTLKRQKRLVQRDSRYPVYKSLYFLCCYFTKRFSIAMSVSQKAW